jgi:hypothetical protein
VNRLGGELAQDLADVAHVELEVDVVYERRHRTPTIRAHDHGPQPAARQYRYAAAACAHGFQANPYVARAKLPNWNMPRWPPGEWACTASDQPDSHFATRTAW